MNYDKLNKVLSVPSSSYIAPTALGKILKKLGLTFCIQRKKSQTSSLLKTSGTDMCWRSFNKSWRSEYPVQIMCKFYKNYVLKKLFDFLADRTNGRAIATLLRLSSVCNVMYCG